MNPGELRSKVRILNYECIDGVYRFNAIKELYSKVENVVERKAFSKFGLRTDEATAITLRYRKDISKFNAVRFNDDHYLISVIEDIENKHRYTKLITVKQKVYLCEAFRNSVVKDKMNRTQHLLKSIYRFEGYLVEKYTGFNTEGINSNVKHTLILMTPKVINLKAGDIIEINDIKYNVEVCHVLDEYLNEFEITVFKDV